MATKRVPPGFDVLPRYKIVVLGTGGVGKSALTIQYIQKLFMTDHDPTIEDTYQQKDEVDEEWCQLDVLDTAGQEEFSVMRDHYMRKGQGFIIVYSTTDRDSFLEVKRFHAQILRFKNCDSYPMILAANKIDLLPQRKVTEVEGRVLAKELQIYYIETSAKNPPVNVKLLFHELVRLIRRYLAEQQLTNTKQENRKMHCCVL